MLPELQAERQLLAIEAASVPHLKQEKAGQLIDRWVRRARGITAGKSVSQALMESGIPIRLIPPRRPTGQPGTRRKAKRE
jgi:hypothetical protein